MRKGTEIHKITRIPLSTIYDNIKKLKEDNIVNRKKGSGRPRKITGKFSRSLGQSIRRDTSVPTRTLAKKLGQMGLEVSHSTVSRHLTVHGYKKSLPRATPMLTAAHKQKCIEWAQQHINDNWNTTLFSDETAFQLFRNTVKRWHKKIRPIRPMPKDRTKIFAWGGFCVTGKTSLFCFRRIMNAEFYVEILENHIPEIDAMLGDDWRLQQDNDPKHTSRLAKEFLQNNVPEVMDWPSNSPDLNPIENLWAIVKGNVERRMPKNLNELESFMAEEWSAIPDTMIKNLAGSMKRRCELIIENNGERISY
ncbi:IS630 family transposase [Rhizophagus irregularis DAOM 181602=DAOM 197198]|nr:IS630 family transposase [Rhizophagus irregularis DAOM 181602=DAOM 197198]